MKNITLFITFLTWAVFIAIFILFFNDDCNASDYTIKDSNNNQKYHIKDSKIVDKNWNKKFTIRKDGTIVDNNWNKVGKIEKRK